VVSWLRAAPAGCDLAIHIQPGASRSEVAGEHGQALKIRIHARPVEGAANEALIGFLAGRLGIARGAVTIVRGEKSRQKTVRVMLAAADVERLLVGSME
jgi:uncharacterized protein (TIGR00251 family)